MPLGEFFLGCLSTKNRLKRIRVIARIPCFCGNGHRSRGEVLHLFQMEIELFGMYGKLSHVFLFASRVGGYEVGDNLLSQVLLCVDAVEDALELFKQIERWLSHQVKYVVGSMFRSYLQTAAYVSANQFACVLFGGFVRFLVACTMKQQVVANAASNEAFLYLG